VFEFNDTVAQNPVAGCGRILRHFKSDIVFGPGHPKNAPFLQGPQMVQVPDIPLSKSGDFPLP